MENTLNDAILNAVRQIVEILSRRDEHEDYVLDTEEQEKVIRMVAIVQNLSFPTDE